MKAFLFLFLLASQLPAFGQSAEINGNIHLPAEWKNEVYVCRIPDYNSMYQASDALLVASGRVDSTGNFHLTFSASADESLFRIQFRKDNDPVSTIIIGGKDENHAFFIARASEKIYFLQDSAMQTVSQTCIKGGSSNEELTSLLRLAKSDTMPRDSVKERLIRRAKDSRSELVSLLSVHLMFGLSSSQKGRVSEILSRLNRSNPYGERIFLEYKKDRTWIYAFIFLAVGLIALGAIGTILFKRRALLKLVRLLSPREINVVTLVMEGKSNKEIAGILNIELSTVKTHVNNAYAKLKISDRKGLIKYQRSLRPLK